MRIVILILTSTLIFACKDNKISAKKIESLEMEEVVIMEYYNPNFMLEPTSKLKTNGYYEVKEFETFDFKEKEDYYERPNYGFIQFFKDGFCRIGQWNGMRKYSDDVKKDFESGSGVLNGLYQIKSDTIEIEYLIFSKNPIPGRTKFRQTMTGLISKDKIIFIEGPSNYIYPYKHADTMTSRCVGTFLETEFEDNNWPNYLKDNISEYLENNK